MRRVVVEAELANAGDLFIVASGADPNHAVRTVVVDNALVDTGCTSVGLPPSIIERLGLTKHRTVVSQAATGKREVGLYGPLRVTIQGRFATVDAHDIAETAPPLIGQIPLEMMDFVVDPRNQRLIGNPEHNGEQMLEAY